MPSADTLLLSLFPQLQQAAETMGTTAAASSSPHPGGLPPVIKPEPADDDSDKDKQDKQDKLGSSAAREGECAQASPTSSARLQPGTAVIIHSLRSQRQLNNTEATVLSFDEAKQRYVLKTAAQDKPISVRPGNCRDKDVEVHNQAMRGASMSSSSEEETSPQMPTPQPRAADRTRGRSEDEQQQQQAAAASAAERVSTHLQLLGICRPFLTDCL